MPLNVQHHGQYPNIFCFSEKVSHVRHLGGPIVKIGLLVFSQSRFEISLPHKYHTGEFAWELAAKLGEFTGCCLLYSESSVFLNSNSVIPKFLSSGLDYWITALILALGNTGLLL